MAVTLPIVFWANQIFYFAADLAIVDSDFVIAPVRPLSSFDEIELNQTEKYLF